MKNKIFTILLFLFYFHIFSQNIGDFLSKSTVPPSLPFVGNWTSASSWLKWDGTAYVNASEYPGQTAGSANANVIIAANSEITFNPITNFDINVKNITVQGTLILLRDLKLPTTNNFYIDKGLVLFDKFIKLILPVGASLSMNIDNINTQGLHPKDGNPDCNGNTAVVIGGVYYTACEGGGVGHTINGTFDDLNTTAVYFRSNPAANPNLSAVCNGTNMQLIGSYIYSGNLSPAPTPATVSYLWQLISAPAGYVFANSTSQNPVIGALNIEGTYVFRLTVSFGGRNSFKDIQIEVGKSTTFSSSGWSNGAPNINVNAIINGVYATSTYGSFEACNCNINSGASLAINASNYVKVQNNISNLGVFSVESDGNLLQVNPLGTYTGNNLTVKRNAQLKRLDYNYWGSPVIGQNFINFSPQTLSNRFYTYNEVDDSFSVISNLNNNFSPGKGYAIRAPNNFSTSIQTFVGEFKGVPNNGDVTISVAYTNADRGKNMLSNPYPSNIDLRILHQNNPKSGGIFYFWTNDEDSWSYNVNTSNGSYGIYTKNQYAVLNLLGSVPASTPAESTVKYPSAIIKPGQGFILQASSSGNFKFDNSIRTSATTDGTYTSIFFNRVASSNKIISSSENIKGRYWLSLMSPLGTKNLLLLGYANDALNNYDAKYDAEIISNSSDGFYSVLEDKKLAIQGREFSLMKDDIVNLGCSYYAPGIYTIKLENKDGVFDNEQSVYLKDKELDITIDLSKTSYTFKTENAGVNETRFEIVYRNESMLANYENLAKKEIEIIKKTQDIYTLISKDRIKTIMIYDSSGKLLKRFVPNSKSIEIDVSFLIKGIYVIGVTTEKGYITKKILK